MDIVDTNDENSIKVNYDDILKELEQLKLFCYNRALAYSNITTDFKNIGQAMENLTKVLSSSTTK